MAALSVHPAGTPAGANTTLLCILYCEFDPHKGPRPVFQVPANYVSVEVCEILSDHLIASSELCGHLISVAAFGFQFVGHPEYIRHERYERNQFMYNVCFVFDAQTDVTAYRPLIRKVAKYFRTIEDNHCFLSAPETRGRIEEIITGIFNDIKSTGQLRMPPSDVQDLPSMSESLGGDALQLQQFPRLDELPQVHLHEVPVWVSSNQDTPLQHSHPFVTQLMPFFTEDGRDGGSDLATIVRKTSLDVSQVFNVVALLMQRKEVRLVDRVRMNNVYVCTSALRTLPKDTKLRQQCVEYSRAKGATRQAAFASAYQLLCAVDPSKRLSQVCESLRRPGSGGGGGGGAGGSRAQETADLGNIDVMRLMRFASVFQFIRRIHHWPLWVGPDGGGGGVRRPDPGGSGGRVGGGGGGGRGGGRNGGNRELSSKILAYCDGRYCYDAIACALGLTVEEVEDECERGPHKDEILVIARMEEREEGGV